jgi:hypothetical protein
MTITISSNNSTLSIVRIAKALLKYYFEFCQFLIALLLNQCTLVIYIILDPTVTKHSTPQCGGLVWKYHHILGGIGKRFRVLLVMALVIET